MNYIYEYYKRQKELTAEEKLELHQQDIQKIALNLELLKKDLEQFQNENSKLNRDTKTKLYEERFDLFGTATFDKEQYGEYKLNYHSLAFIEQEDKTKYIKYINEYANDKSESKTIEAEKVKITHKSQYYTHGEIKESGAKIKLTNDYLEFGREIHYMYNLFNQKYIAKKTYNEGPYKDIRYDQTHTFQLSMNKNIDSYSFGITDQIPVFKNISEGELIVSACSLEKSKYSISTKLHNRFYIINLITGHVSKVCNGIDKKLHESDETNDDYNFTGIYISRYIEELYALEPNSLPDDINLRQYLTILKYTNNLFQSFLQVGSKSPWFISNLAKTIRSAGKPIQDKNIQTWLDISLPDFKHLTAQPNQDMLIHFMIANKNKPVSLQEFLKTENKIIELNNKWLKEFDKRKSVNSVNASESVIFRNKRNKYLFSSSTLPQFMVTYVNKGIYHNHSLYRYLKYIIDEGKRSYNKDAGTYLTLKDIESNLIDYNRMLKEINPKSKFILPYKIKNAHDTMVINFNEIMTERRILGGDCNGKNESYIEKYSKADHTRYSDDKYMVLAPQTTYELYDEGSSLNHCVGGYGDKIRTGKCLIYFLREKHSPKKPLVTVEVIKKDESFYINQSKGIGNRLANNSEREFLGRWLNDYQRSYQENKLELAKQAKERLANVRNEILKTNNFSIHITEALKLCGYVHANYNESISKTENYSVAIQEGLIQYTTGMIKEDCFSEETLESAMDQVRQALKKEGFKQKEIAVQTKEEIIALAQAHINNDRISNYDQER